MADPSAPSIKRPQRPPDIHDLLGKLAEHPDRLLDFARLRFHGSQDPKYRHWDTLRHLTPPNGFTTEQWWLGIKLGRISMARATEMRDERGDAFTYCMPDEALRLIHIVDQSAAGRLGTSEVVTNPATRDRYIVSSMIEEAITSSQLEGASTSKAVAKEMLRSGRPPNDRSEQMILNNYKAMQYVRRFQGPLSVERIRELHRIVTDKTLDDPRDAGRMQAPGEERVKVFNPRGEVLHEPPPAEYLTTRLESLCEFANGRGHDNGFMHPVIRSIITHFWLSYDHPFVDGNGRTARALFYWSMLSQGYWLSEFLAISSILRKAPSQYAKSFTYVETDDNDLTYFIMYQLKVICRAVEALNKHLQRKISEVQAAESLARSAAWLNHRQLALLGHALRDPGASYTYASHATSHNVVLQTARTDLLALVDAGLLVQQKRGRKYYFMPHPELSDRLERASGQFE